MRYKETGIGGDIFSIIEHQRKVSSSNKGVNRINKALNWEEFRDLLEDLLGYTNRKSKGGRPPFDPVFMFKVLILQKFHNLSDEGVAEQIADRFSFMEFLGLRPGDPIPQASTIWDFKELLEKDSRNGSELLFKHFSTLLEGEGIVSKEGSIVDASFVDAPKQRNTREENKAIKEGVCPESLDSSPSKLSQKDLDARWALKNKELHYGYKNHAKVDAKSKIVMEYATTAASVHDSQVFKDLVNKTDNSIFADSAYYSEDSESYILNECDCQDFVQMKGNRANPLTEQEIKTNKMRSRIRVRVEHVFGRMSQLGMDYLKSIGISRAHQHNGFSNLVYNMDRYAFLKFS